MVLKQFVQEDGAVHHIVSFDPQTGERIERSAARGLHLTRHGAGELRGLFTAWPIRSATQAMLPICKRRSA